MYSYALLEPECYYLVQEKESGPLVLIQVKVVSDSSMFVLKYGEVIAMDWKLKTDNIFDIVELLSDEVAKEWMKVYYDNEDAYYEEDDE